MSLVNLLHEQVFLLGALAKLGATVSTYPLLVVKVYLALWSFHIVFLNIKNSAVLESYICI